MLARGRALSALAGISLAFWVISAATSWVTQFAFSFALSNPFLPGENIVAEMEDVQGKLKKLFADDIQKIALFGGGERVEIRVTNPAVAGCMGCLPGFMWAVLSWPLLMAIGLAFYDGLLRLFASSEGAATLLVSAGSHAAELRAMLPLGRNVSVGFLPAIALSERSLPLTGILFSVGLLSWFVMGISNSGRTVPRMAKLSPVCAYCVSMVLTYFYLNAAILIFATCGVSYSLFYGLLRRVLLNPLYLWVRSATARWRILKKRGLETESVSTG